MRRKMTTETALKRAAVQLLKVHRIYNFPIVATLGSPPGLPDRLAIKDGRAIAIEFKAPGRKLTDHQENVKAQVEAAGGLWITCRSLDDLYEHLNLPGRLF